jgi:hypothetical protein
MAGTRRALILSALVSALEAIQTSAGYNTNVKATAGGGGAQKLTFPFNTATKRPVLYVSIDSQEPSEQRGAGGTGGGYYEPVCKGAIACLIDVDPADAVDDKVDTLLADVEKVLLTQAQADPVLGVAGVVDLMLDGFTYFDPAKGRGPGAEYRFKVRYRHDSTSSATFTGLT